jgi:hypothetical protein
MYLFRTSSTVSKALSYALLIIDYHWNYLN